MQKDRGLARRIRSFLRAQIIFNDRLSTIDCVIKNISATGAKIALDDTLAVPSEFDVFIPQKSRSRHAKMVWRDKESIGVQFTDPQDLVPLTGTHPFQAIELPGDSPEERIRQLEISNAGLRARIRALSKKLEDLGEDP